MGIYDELQKISADSPTPVKVPSLKKETKPNKKSIDQRINQSIDQSIDQSTNQSISQFTPVNDIGPVIEKPRGFYITEKVDKWLGNAVRYLQDKGLHKVDRAITWSKTLYTRISW